MTSPQTARMSNDDGDTDLDLDLDSKPVPQLIETLNKYCLAAVQDKDAAQITFLCPAATDAEISDLQARLGTAETPYELPTDYVRFLRSSDGFFLHGTGIANNEPDLEAILYDIKNVQSEDSIDLKLFQANPILHPLPSTLCRSFDWPDVSGIDIGPAGDEGSLWLFGPQQLQPFKDKIVSMYSGLQDDDKKTLEELVVKLYGSVQKMMQQQWTILEFFHWSPDVKLHLGFRAYLEQAIRRRIHGEEE